MVSFGQLGESGMTPTSTWCARMSASSETEGASSTSEGIDLDGSSFLAMLVELLRVCAFL